MARPNYTLFDGSSVHNCMAPLWTPSGSLMSSAFADAQLVRLVARAKEKVVARVKALVEAVAKVEVGPVVAVDPCSPRRRLMMTRI